MSNELFGGNRGPIPYQIPKEISALVDLWANYANALGNSSTNLGDAAVLKK